MRKPIIGTIKRRLTAEMLYWKLDSLLFLSTILLKVAKPNREQVEAILTALEELRSKLEVD